MGLRITVVKTPDDAVAEILGAIKSVVNGGNVAGHSRYVAFDTRNFPCREFGLRRYSGLHSSVGQRSFLHGHIVYHDCESRLFSQNCKCLFLETRFHSTTWITSQPPIVVLGTPQRCLPILCNFQIHHHPQEVTSF